jgi:hypothetical protein
MNEMKKLIGIPTDIIRIKTNSSPRTFCVFKIGRIAAKAFGKNADFMLNLPPNTRLEIEGYFSRSAKYGNEFIAEHGQIVPAENKNPLAKTKSPNPGDSFDLSLDGEPPAGFGKHEAPADPWKAWEDMKAEYERTHPKRGQIAF